MQRNDEPERQGASTERDEPTQEVGDGTDEDPAAHSEPAQDFPEVPSRDVGLGHTTDVNAPPNTTGHTEDVPEPPD